MEKQSIEAVKSVRDKQKSMWLRTLDEVESDELPLVGGKAVRLAVLRQHGLNVPPGLVLTTDFFETHIREARLTPLWAGSPDIAVTSESLNWLSDTLKTRPIPQKLTEALNKALKKLFDPMPTAFAVRSSAVEEDQHDHTFAGIHLTELGVPFAALPIAITRCWASALDKPALEYRQVNGMSIQGIRIAVLIQPMLTPISSGVSFTMNPLTGAREEIIVEATWGSGQAVVGGQVQPYFYKLANHPPDYPILEQHSGNAPPPETLESTSQQAEQGPLPPSELTELVTQLEKIQALMGEGQDVEWARQDDRFFILQTRPITAIPDPQPILDWEWTQGSHRESLPELPSPFFTSLLEASQNRGITFFKDEFGLDVEELGPYVKSILGRPYLNLTFLRRIIAQIGISPGSLLYTIGHTEPGRAGPLSIDWELAWKSRVVYGQALRHILNTSHYVKEFLALVDEMETKLENPDVQRSSSALLRQFRQHHSVYSEFFNTNLQIGTALSAATAIASTIVAPLTPSPATFITGLAFEGMKTAESDLNKELPQLAELVCDNEQMQQYWAEAPDDFSDYPENPLIPDIFKQKFAQLLEKYGQQATYETDLGWPRYEEAPEILLRIIRHHNQSRCLGEPKTIPSSEKKSFTWKTLIQEAAWFDRWVPWRRYLAAPFITYLRYILKKREQFNRAKARVMAAFRKWDLALGQKWVKQNWLTQKEDIFWLTMDEIERTLIVGSDMGLTLSSIVRARKETYQIYAETEMPFSLRESQISSIQLGLGLASERASDVIVGLPISPGQVQGTALVIHKPEDFEQLTDDLILIMPSTDPAWLPLLHMAAGLIVEMGGLLSHGSVIAREYGLPAVANIPDATKRFHTGDKVLVDGSTGVIQILETV